MRYLQFLINKLGYSALGMITVLSTAQSNELTENYIRKYKEIAVSEMQRTGIPASIKLAQALLESNWGRSELTRKAKNHFGIKCGPSWKGKTFYRKDDDFNHKGELVRSCFRVYDEDILSFIAHSDFLTDPRKSKRYGFLFSYSPTDYKSWAKGLYKAGYASDPAYASKIIQIIEQFDLHRYDQEDLIAYEESNSGESYSGSSLSQKKHRNPTSQDGWVLVNGVKAMYPKQGESLENFAKRTPIGLDLLKEYNEKLGHNSTALEAEIPVFLSAKKEKYTGSREEHRVRRGETMYFIAQKYGVQLKKLYSYNRIPIDSEPLPGEMIKLNSYAHWGRRPKFIEKAVELIFDDSDVLFSDVDFESSHSQR